MINLFEYQNKEPFNDDLDGLEAFLDDVWQKRDKVFYYYQNAQSRIESQRFLQFIHKSDEIKSNKYVGVIRYGDHKINLLPKIFFDQAKAYSSSDVSQIHLHLLWWLSYCRKIKFPSYLSALGERENDFFEILIYLFSKYTRELLGSMVFQQYQEVDQEQSFIKGRLDTSTYIRKNVGTGRWHKFSCTYDAFVIDNAFNRIVKYVTTMLFNATSNQDNKKNLREILFILDEVSDERATTEQCSKIKFNPMFEQFTTVRDYCQLFLSNSISFDYNNDLKLFAFLLPMEYVFEDFIYGFIEKELPDVVAKSQRSDTNLDESGMFGLKPDLFIKTATRSIIADTKYKLVYTDATDPKRGIGQQDLYQVVSYAIRFQTDQAILFYPDSVTSKNQPPTRIQVNDQLAGGIPIYIQAVQLPIINWEVLENQSKLKGSLQEVFQASSDNLRDKLRMIIG